MVSSTLLVKLPLCFLGKTAQRIAPVWKSCERFLRLRQQWSARYFHRALPLLNRLQRIDTAQDGELRVMSIHQTFGIVVLGTGPKHTEELAKWYFAGCLVRQTPPILQPSGLLVRSYARSFSHCCG